MAFTVEQAVLVSIFVESILYGFLLYIVLICISIFYGQYSKCRESRTLNIRLISVLLVMFMLATAHLASSFHKTFYGLIVIERGGERAKGFTELLETMNTVDDVVGIAIYGVQTLVGDCFMIYRMYIVWTGNKAVCVPATVTFVASAVIGVVGFVTRQEAAGLSAITQIDRTTPWIIPFLWLTFFTNGYSAGLIAGRIWWMTRRIRRLTNSASDGTTLGRAGAIIIESGAAYSSCLILLNVLYLSHVSMGIYTVWNIMTQIIAIIFSLIIVRVARGVSTATTNDNMTAIIFHDSNPARNSSQISTRQWGPGPESRTPV